MHDDTTGDHSPKPMEKPIDKPAKQYSATESVPPDSFNAESLAESFENPGDLSKRFM